MYKRLILCALALLLAFAAASCSLIGPAPSTTGGGTAASGQTTENATTVTVNDDKIAAAIKEVEELLSTARYYEDFGVTFQSEYIYGLAQGEISSLRLCIDHLLFLKGEGKSLAEVIGNAPYKDWDAVVGAGLASDAPAYFEGLIYTFRGKNDEAQACYEIGKRNPVYKERDFYYLRNLSVSELYALKTSVSALERQIYDEYTPRTALTDPHTGAEFEPQYHLALAEGYDNNPAKKYQCALNALMSNPGIGKLYSNAALCALDANKPMEAIGIVNQGLYASPKDTTINYVAAIICAGAGDNAKAKAHLDIAKATATGELLTQINALYEKIGG